MISKAHIGREIELAVVEKPNTYLLHKRHDDVLLSLFSFEQFCISTLYVVYFSSQILKSVIS